jgi:cation-transporting ATPase 13A3/4/5
MPNLSKGSSLYLEKESLRNIFSSELIPGDLVKLESNTIIPCDMLLIKGSCLVDESILTGESIPITKISAESDNKINSLNIVYGGSQCILEKSDQVLGLVINTGWNGFKGKIISSLSNTTAKQNLIVEQMIEITKVFIIISTFIVAAILIYDAIYRQIFLVRVFKYLSDFMIKSFQPTTWFLLFISAYIISTRLNSSKIMILNPKKLFNVGLTDTICFDKTGTLTENKIIFNGVIMRDIHGNFTKCHSSIQDTVGESKFNRLLAMTSCCHDLFVHEGELIGDPIDMELFKFSGSSMNIIRNDLKFIVGERKGTLRDTAYVRPQTVFSQVMGKPKNYGFGIVKIFPFSSEKKRMAVMVKGINNLGEIEKNDKNSYYTNKMIFESNGTQESKDLKVSKFLDKSDFCYLVKGAAESIKKICKQETIPEDFDEKVNEYAQQGLRIIALASKSVTDPNKTQSELEQDLDFLGLMMFDNPLKPSTKPIIDKLKFNNMNCKMITGDHLYAAINVGYMSGILEQTESLWICALNKQNNNLNWKFSTFEELMKMQDVQKNQDLVIQEKRTNKISIEQSILKKLSEKNQSILTSHRKYKYEIRQANIHDLPGIISSAQKSSVKASIAMEGSCFDYLINKIKLTPQQHNFILKRTKIFGRANPDQKRNIINSLRHQKNPQNICVGFVGDGANDFKALNQADFGLSIDNTEASIASPFVSSKSDLSIIEHLLNEGRNSVENFDQIFIYSILNSVIDYICLIIILKHGFYFNNWKYILDFFLRLPILLMLCTISPVSNIRRIKPNSTLINSRFYSILICTVIVSFVSFMIGLAILYRFTFYKRGSETFNSVNLDVENHYSPQTNMLIMLLFFLNFGNFMISFKGREVKKSWYSHTGIIIYVIVFLVIFSFTINPEFYYSPEFIFEFFVRYARVVDFPGHSLMKWIIFCVISFMLMYFSGSYVLNYFYYKSLRKARLKYKNRFLENVPQNMEENNSLHEQIRAYKEKNSFSTISVSHSIIYDQ